MVEDNTNVKGSKTSLCVLSNVYWGGGGWWYTHVYLREWCRDNRPISM